MALTAAEVCNRALLRIGQRQTIDSLEEATAESMACKALYADTRDALLEMAQWSFATRRATLALISGAERDGWGYVYALPTDCLVPRSIWSGTRNPAADTRIAYALEDDATTGKTVLLTDEADAVLIYTRKVETVALFTPSFVDALAWLLAIDLCLALPVKPQVSQMVERKAQQAVALAIANDFQRQREDVPPEAEHIRDR